MTERGRNAVDRTAEGLQIGPSALHWENGTLVIEIDERSCPIPRRIKGTIRVTPEGLPAASFALDPNSRHMWQPIAPKARIAVALDHPQCHWSGGAYLDSNQGSEPLEAGFEEWTWSRAHLRQSTVVLYDAHRRDGSDTSLALQIVPDGTVRALEPPPRAFLPKTGWRMVRSARGNDAKINRTLEDTPFYVRSLVDMRLCEERCLAVHESLSLRRFRSNIVRAMLPFRMPRRIF